MPASELTLRWAVAAVGVPVVVAILYVGAWPLVLAVAALAGLGAHECYRLGDERGVRPFVPLGVIAASGFVVLAGLSATAMVFAATALALTGVLVLLSLLGATFWRGPEGGPMGAASLTILGALYAGLPLAVVPLLHALPMRANWGESPSSAWAGVVVVALPLASTWVGDAAAFFAGRAWGRRRLAPSISPKKSWAGAVAGVLGAAAAAVAWHVLVGSTVPGAPFRGTMDVALLGALLGVAAILGDLVESVLKREAGVKDSGTLLPGHGGVLDRIDAMLFTVPVAYAGLLLLEVAR